jgi:hypothetical protein
MDDDKVMEEEEEEEKEQFFSDLVAADDRDEEEETMDEDMDDADADAPMSTGSESGATPAAPTTTSAPGPATGGPSERRAMVGASPYVAPFTPLSSPNQPKTPSSVTAAQRMGSGSGGKKPQLIPMKNGGGFASGPPSSKVLKDDIVTHLPDALVDALVNTVQTLDKLIVGVEDFKADQLGFLTDKVNAYVDLLKSVDAAGANYDALIPLGVLEYVLPQYLLDERRRQGLM